MPFCAGLAPTLSLAARCGLHVLLADHVQVRVEGGANRQLKVPALSAGVVDGADCINGLHASGKSAANAAGRR